MSLLDDVSIVVTPNGYKAGELYAVVPAASLGNNVIVNGDFTADRDWNKGTGWTISGGSANCDGSQTGATNLTPNVDNVTNNTVYKTTYTISNYVSGSIRIKLGNTGQGQYHSANGTYTEEIKALVTTFPRSQFNADVDFKGSIDNVLVEEVISADMDVTRATAATRVDEAGLVNYAEIIGSELVTNGDFATDSDWTKGTGWTISSGSASHTGGASYLIQDILSPNTLYKVEISVTASGGFVQIYMGNSPASVLISQIGDYIYYFTSQSNVAVIGFGLRSLGDVTIDNVSVKEAARDNVPRIDYTGGGCPHILAEPQSTNLFINSIWDGGTDNVSAPTSWSLNDISDPIYTYSTSQYTSGKKINIQGTGSRLILSQSVTIQSNSLVNVSVKVKYISGSISIDKIASTLSPPSDSIKTYYYNGILVADAFILTEDGILEMRVSSVTGGSVGVRLGLGTSGAATGHIELDMPQCETLTYRTSFIPTTTSTVTRNQDQFSREGIGSLINSTEGVLFAEIAALANDGTVRYLSLSNGTSNNRVTILYYSSNNNIRAIVSSGGSNVMDVNSSVSSVLNFHKVAVKYKSNDFALWINGIKVATDTSGSAPIGLNKLALDLSGANNFFGKVKQLQVYKTALTDEQLIQLTGESGTDFYESYAEMASALTYTIQ